MRFTAIDFETANSSRASMCSVGLSFIDDGEIIGGMHQLIRPNPLYFDPFNISIHGITPEDVVGAPSFSDFWNELKEKITGPLVAHNASFDMSVLRHALDQSEILYPEINYCCTKVISKLTWPQYPSYSLEYLTQKMNISFEHHNAAEDARACAIIALLACKTFGFQSLDNFKELKGFRMRSLQEDGHTKSGAGGTIRPSRRFFDKVRAADLSPTVDVFDPGHPFFGMSIAFTGTMAFMQKREAMQAVIDRGGFCHDSVKLSTDILVLGQQGYIGYCAGHKSVKMRKAEQMLSKGLEIEILSEEEFIKML